MGAPREKTMALIEVGDVYRINFVTRFTEQYGQNARSFVVNAIDQQMTDIGLANALEAVFAPLYKAVLTATSEYAGLKMWKVGTPPGIPIIQISLSGAGTVLGNVSPPQVSVLASLRGQVGGRRGMGRIYFPFVPDSFVDQNSKLNPGNVLIYDALALAMTNEDDYTFGGATATLSWGHVLPGSATFDVWQTVRIREALATQRRRSFINHGDVSPLT